MSLLDNSAVAIGDLGAGGGACFEWIDGNSVLYPSWDGGTVAGNSVEAVGGVAVGGGIAFIGEGSSYLDGMHLFVADNVASGDEALGGGFGNYGDNPGTGWAWFQNSIFANNAAAGASAVGGAIGLGFDFQVGLAYADLVGNVAETAGGAAGAVGTGLVQVSLQESNIVANSAPDGSAFGWLGGSPYFRTVYSNLHDHAAPESTDPARVSAYADISADPLYLDTSAASAVDWDLHLDPSSPCVDAFDFSADPDGTYADIGAYGGPYGSGYHDHWK